MSITSYQTTVAGNTTIVRVTSSLSGTVYYFWFADGAYFGRTTSPTFTFVLDIGDQNVVVCLDSNDPNYNAIANAPHGYPARRSLVFVQSTDASVARYRVEQSENGGAWTAIAFVAADSTKWTYEILSPRLTDLTTYAWRVVPIDDAGNDGSPQYVGSELIVRTPDAPNFVVTFDAVHDQVHFAAA